MGESTGITGRYPAKQELHFVPRAPFTGRKIMTDTKKGQTLLHVARAAIAKEFGFVSHDLPRTAWLEEPGATFVTLTLHGRQHGCIGSLEAQHPLIEDVRRNAVAAAFQDPRSTPLTKEEFADVSIEVALLSTPETIHFSSEQDALAQLKPGSDGAVFEYGPHRATFLPHAWADFPHAQDFLARLKSQAGLAEDFWSVDIRLSRFTIHKWREGK